MAEGKKGLIVPLGNASDTYMRERGKEENPGDENTVGIERRENKYGEIGRKRRRIRKEEK